MQYHMGYIVILTGVLSFMVINVGLSQIDFWTLTNGPNDVVVSSFAVNSGNWVYAGTSRGVYRSTDNGSSWTGIGPADTAFSSVAIGTNGRIFAGGRGIFRSSDDGAHWTSLVLDTLSPFTYYIYSLAVDAGGTVFAGCFTIFRSTDNGEHWTSPWSKPDGQTIVPVPAGPIFAGDYSGVYRSSDEGQSWDRKIHGLDDTTVGALGYDQTGYVYAGIWGTGIYRSPDNGENWERADSGVTNHYISTIASNAIDQVFAGTAGGGVFRSTDNGDHWQSVNSGLTNQDIKCLAMSPDGYLYAGTNGGGIFRSAQTTLGLQRMAAGIPAEIELSQNYPNPFNPSTKIKYSLPKSGYVTLTIYDILGREFSTLVNVYQDAGYKSVQFNADNLPSGVYFYRLQAGTFTETRKLVVLR